MKKIIFQRHGAYQGGFPKHGWGKPTPKEKKALGRLTLEGVEEVRQRTQKRLVGMGDVTGKNFLLVHSPTYWLDDPHLGQRAYETSVVVAEEIQRAGGNVIANRLDSRLGEALMFQTPFADFLRKKYGGGQGEYFWEAFYVDTFRKERLGFGAEGPRDIAERVHLAVLNLIQMLQCIEGDMVVWVVTHGDCTIPYGMFLGASWEEIPNGYNDGFKIEVHDRGLNVAIIAGKEHFLKK